MWTGSTWPRTNPVSCSSRLLSPTSIQWPLSRTYSTSCNSKMGVAEITKVEEEQKNAHTKIASLLDIEWVLNLERAIRQVYYQKQCRDFWNRLPASHIREFKLPHLRRRGPGLRRTKRDLRRKKQEEYEKVEYPPSYSGP